MVNTYSARNINKKRRIQLCYTAMSHVNGKYI